MAIELTMFAVAIEGGVDAWKEAGFPVESAA